jgi:predicted MPP superfamily phosphohydrolase
LNATHGVFSVLGNHDHMTNKRVVLTGLKESGLPVLINDGVTLSRGQQVLYLAGLDDGRRGHPDLPKALEKRPGQVPTILLVHEPDFADTYSTDGTISLQLSGHSHGGQIRLPGVGALALPRYGRKYDQGLYRVQDMWLYTTRGIGVTGPPIRLNCRPEITEITLVQA